MTQAKNTRRTQAQWQSLVDAQAKSGQSAKRYCGRQRLNQQTGDAVTSPVDKNTKRQRVGKRKIRC